MSESKPPTLSPDGKYWWDGQAWQPMPGTVSELKSASLAAVTEKRGFGLLTRMQVKFEKGSLEVRYGINRVRVPADLVTAAITRRARHGAVMKSSLVLVGGGADLGAVEIGATMVKAGEQAAEWINEILRQHRG